MQALKRKSARFIVVAGICMSLAPLSAGAAQEQMDAQLPFGASPGDTVTMTVTVGSSCKPGTPEVGFSTKPSGEFQPGNEDPRTGDEIVLLRPTQAPGTTFEIEIVIPDTGTDKPTFYALCQYHEKNEAAFGPGAWIGSYRGFHPGGGFRPPSPSPTTANRPPVAQDDAFDIDAGKTLTVAGSGVLRNDSDPDGDTIVAVIGARTTTTDALVRLRPDGRFELRAAKAGVVCLEYTARDAKGAASSPAIIVVSIGGAKARDEVVEGDRCREVPPEGSLFRLTLADGEGELGTQDVSGTALAGAGSLGHPALGRGMVGPPAIRLPRGAQCSVIRCLYGFWAPPYLNCNQTVVTSFFGSRYGSMTAWGYLRRGKADFVKVRGFYYEDGRLIHTTGWKKKYFPTSFFDSWVSFQLHQRFRSAGSRYQVGFQAEWYLENVDWWHDRQIAAGREGVPYICTAAYGDEF